jgi:hypothetical protein
MKLIRVLFCTLLFSISQISESKKDVVTKSDGTKIDGNTTAYPGKEPPKKGDIVVIDKDRYVFTGEYVRDSLGKILPWFVNIGPDVQGKVWSGSEGGSNKSSPAEAAGKYLGPSNRGDAGTGSNWGKGNGAGQGTASTQGGSGNGGNQGLPQDGDSTRIWEHDLSGFDHDSELKSDPDFKAAVDQYLVAAANKQAIADIEANIAHLSAEVVPKVQSVSMGQFVSNISDIRVPNVMTKGEFLDQQIRSKSSDQYYASVSAVGWRIDDIMPYQSARSGELNSLKNRFDTISPNSPQQRLAKDVGVTALRQADNEFLNSPSSPEGEVYVEVAKSMLDIATDLFPPTGIPKDIYRVLTGMDLNGDELTTFERSLSLASLLTMGSIRSISTIERGMNKLIKILSDAKIVRATSQAITAAKIAFKGAADVQKLKTYQRALLNIPKHLMPSRMIVGTSNKVAIIGRDMKFVRQAADALRKTHEVVIFDGQIVEGISKAELAAAREEFKELVKRHGWLEPEIIEKTKLLKVNMKWVDHVKKMEYTVIDLGIPKGAERSLFYEWESMHFFKEMPK